LPQQNIGEDANRRYRSEATKRNLVWGSTNELGAKFVGIAWQDMD
jgi:hypothetical protein